MARLRQQRLLFGASVTVTADNLETVTAPVFFNELEQAGCKAVLFAALPVAGAAPALNDADRAALTTRVDAWRSKPQGILAVSFPGDEAQSGGCLAAGRGFFHVNATGGAEPCPFSPYSDVNVRNVSLLEALQSPLFARLRTEGLLAAPHTGGCVLFEQRGRVAELCERALHGRHT